MPSFIDEVVQAGAALGAGYAGQRALERAHRLLEDRADDERILAEEPVTVGRLREVLTQALANGREGPAA